MPSDPVLSPLERAFLGSARRATLATIASDRRPRLVPICFVVDDDQPVVYSPLDDKPKRSEDPASLARVRDLAADPRVSILVDRWDEDWTRLAWLRCDGRATLLGPPDAAGSADAGIHARVVAALRARYPQYATHRLESRPIIRIAIERATSWGSLATP